MKALFCWNPTWDTHHRNEQKWLHAASSNPFLSYIKTFANHVGKSHNHHVVCRATFCPMTNSVQMSCRYKQDVWCRTPSAENSQILNRDDTPRLWMWNEGLVVGSTVLGRSRKKNARLFPVNTGRWPVPGKHTQKRNRCNMLCDFWMDTEKKSIVIFNNFGESHFFFKLKIKCHQNNNYFYWKYLDNKYQQCNQRV